MDVEQVKRDLGGAQREVGKVAVAGQMSVQGPPSKALTVAELDDFVARLRVQAFYDGEAKGRADAYDESARIHGVQRERDVRVWMDTALRVAAKAIRDELNGLNALPRVTKAQITECLIDVADRLELLAGQARSGELEVNL